MTSKEALRMLETRCRYFATDNLEIEEIYEARGIIEKDLEVLECFKKYFNFELVFEKNQTFLIFKSKERYLPVDDKLSISNKYYEPLKEWLENEK